MKLFLAALTAMMVLTFVGCGSMEVASLPSSEKPGDPEYAPVPSDSLLPPPGAGGSLFSDAYGLSLYGDKKARRVGDIITVLLDESTQGSKSSAASSSKSSSAEITAPTVAGFGPFNSLSAQVEGGRDFSGSGDADQSNSLVGNITVTVSEVLPNGVLRVRGEKWITLNTGAEFIRIKGMLRPDDINLTKCLEAGLVVGIL